MAHSLRVIATGVGRSEGPVIRPDGEILITSMDKGTIYRIDAGGAHAFADTGGSPNGATEWRDGKLYVTQAGGRHSPGTTRVLDTGGIQVVDRAGKVGWLTVDPIAPNDLCFGPDDLLYFTDPTRAREARDDGRLFRCNVETGECELLRTVGWYPNGIAFGPDDAVYVADTGKQRIVRIPLEGGKLGKEETYIRMVSGMPDGFAFDTAGNILIAAIPAPDQPLAQVQIYDKSGKWLDAVQGPDPSHRWTNVALGADRVLIITDVMGGRILAVDGMPNPGLALYPFRKAR